MKKLNDFERKYIDIINELGKKNKSLWWWTLWIPSKNRFNSPLLEQLKRRSNDLPFNYHKHGFLKNLVHSFFSASRLFLFFLYDCLKTQSSLKKFKEIVKDKKIEVISTFSYGRNFNEGTFNDPFWGNFSYFLKQEQKHVLTVLKPAHCYLKTSQETAKLSGVYSFLSFLKIWDFNWAFFQLICGVFRNLNGKYLFNNEDITHLIKDICLEESSSSGVFYALIIFRVMRRISDDFNVDNVYITYENNPWERMTILGIRDGKSSHAKIKGYQHSVVPLASLNMFPACNETEYAPFPDVVYTVGKETANILIDQGEYGEVRVLPACALRYQYLDDLKVRTDPIEKNLLVGLEGVYQATELVDYICSQADKITDWRIVLRFHPVLGLEDMKPLLKNDPQKYKNIVISSEPKVIDDLSSSNVLFYWGSTVALEALGTGMPVIHFDIGDSQDYDPLFSFDDFKWRVSAQDDLAPILKQLASFSIEELKLRRAKGREFIDNYFQPVNDVNLSRFLNFQ